MSVSQRRILALWLPHLSTDRLIRKNGSPEAPLVVSGKAGNALHVQALEFGAISPMRLL